jgi:hypothetical protein
MAIALVTSVLAQAATSAGINTTGATLLVIAQSGQDDIAPTDSRSNTWTACTNEVAGGFGNDTRTYFAVNPTVGSGHTFTPGGTLASIVASAWSGANTSSPKDQESTGTDALNPQPGSVTPTEDNEVIIVNFGGIHSGACTIDGGFTIAQQGAVLGGNYYAGGLAYLIQTTAAAANPNIGNTGGSATAISATFKVAGAGGATLRWAPTMLQIGLQ